MREDPRKYPLSVVDLPEKAIRVRPKHPANPHELDDVEASLAVLNFGHKRLRAFQP